jgi:hypothetical protein
MGMEYEEWLEYGWQQGWVSPPTCYTHDGLPMTEDEDEEFGEGFDPCVYIIRVYEDQNHRLAVEYSDSTLSWRASNRGWVRNDS